MDRGRTRTNMAGLTFKYLTVLNESFTKNINGQIKTFWACLCKCGDKIYVRRSNLINGHALSCGCWRKESMTTHGLSRTKFYITWADLKDRCFNPNHPEYPNYGGRGITVCKRWLKFENFRDDMYQIYLEHVEEFGIKNTSIDRKKVNGNYKPSNCRWATNA